MSEWRVITTPRHVDIAITGRCNLLCAYCFYADEMTARTDLPTERWLAFFEELGRLGVIGVTLTGGEAFARPDLFELIDGLVANRMRYDILSNGTLITEEVLARFETGKRRQRLNSIQVSIDGSNAEIHDRSRPNSFDRSLCGLRLLVHAGFPVTVRVTVNGHNVDDLEAIAHLLLDDIGLPFFSTNETFSCGTTEKNRGIIILTHDQRKRAMETLARLAERYSGRINAQAGPLALAREFRRIDSARATGQTSLPGRGLLSGCGGMWSKLAILHDGTIVPCHNLSPMRLGTIGIDDLQQVWLNHPTMQSLRGRNEIPVSSLDICGDCIYQGFCTGGCPGLTLFITGELNVRNPMHCIRILKGEDPYCTLESFADAR